MLENLLNDLACPKCKKELDANRLRRHSGDIMSGRLICEPCNEEYPIVTGIPSLLPDPALYPVDFLPPETLVDNPSSFRKLHSYPFLEILKHYGKELFMQAIREGKKLPSKDGKKSQSPLSTATRKRAYRCSKEKNFRKVINLMEKRWWKDSRLVSIVEELRILNPEYLLDIATGPGSLLCKSLPLLKETHAIGLEIFFEKCRMVTGEAQYFGFGNRLNMVHGDVRLVPFPDNTFDSVNGWTAAYHMCYYEVAIKEAYRVLRPGGFFIGTFHTEYPSHSRGILTRSEEEEFIRYVHLPLNIQEVKQVFKETGFCDIKTEPVDNSHLIIAKK